MQNWCGSQSASERQYSHPSSASVCTHSQPPSWRCTHPQGSSPGSSQRGFPPQNGPQVGHSGELSAVGVSRLVMTGVAQATVPAAPIRLSNSRRETPGASIRLPAPKPPSKDHCTAGRSSEFRPSCQGLWACLLAAYLRPATRMLSLDRSTLPSATTNCWLASATACHTSALRSGGSSFRMFLIGAATSWR